MTLKRISTFSKTLLRTVRTRLQTKASKQHRKTQKSRKNHWDADTGSANYPQRPAKTLNSPTAYTTPHCTTEPDNRNQFQLNRDRPDRPQTNQTYRSSFQ